MFTGIIDDIGIIEQVADSASGRELTVRCAYTDLAAGESIALNGACLTVREHGRGRFTVAAVGTTLGRTLIGEWMPATRVNLERALRASDRFGGHFVQGHVDGTGIVAGKHIGSDSYRVDIRFPPELAELIVLHGSIAIDGVSLTVNDVPTPELVQVSLIDYTLHHTTLGNLELGQQVHLEADVIGRYLQRLTAPYRWTAN